MDIILIIRLVIFVTFLLLLVEGIGAFIVGTRFYRLYVRKHLELEDRVKVLEQHEKHPE